MSETMRRLRQDHANLSRLLTALERQVTAMQDGAKVDWDILQRILEYCLTYPDLYHHPLEDQILDRLRSKDPVAAAPFTSLEAEHRELSASLRRVAAATMQVMQEAELPREWFVEIVRKFVDAQRDHIRREDSAFYPAAERVLVAVDWADLDGGLSGLPVDPLFGRPTNRQYLSLLSDIKAWEAAEPYDSGPDRSRPKNQP
jgi:hemerythrin-like domain-containing protein